MGRKKKRNNILNNPWCYYCEKVFQNEIVLVNHQKAKHFRCSECNKKMFALGGLLKHMTQVHQMTIKTVPNAIESRTDLKVEVYGSQGIPPEAIAERKRLLSGDTGADAGGSQKRAHTEPQQPVVQPAGYPMQPVHFRGVSPFGAPMGRPPMFGAPRGFPPRPMSPYGSPFGAPMRGPPSPYGYPAPFGAPRGPQMMHPMHPGMYGRPPPRGMPPPQFRPPLQMARPQMPPQMQQQATPARAAPPAPPGRPPARGQHPPARGPPPQYHPARAPPSQYPPARAPPPQHPSARGPPFQHPSARGPPFQHPSARGPPFQHPPARAQYPPARAPAPVQYPGQYRAAPAPAQYPPRGGAAPAPAQYPGTSYPTTPAPAPAQYPVHVQPNRAGIPANAPPGIAEAAAAAVARAVSSPRPVGNGPRLVYNSPLSMEESRAQLPRYRGAAIPPP